MKDPAVLFYISDWLKSTAEMEADVRGWYLNLILHNYDKNDLPNDLEMLAVLCGVKFSEFERFKQVFEQVLKHKFQLKENGRLSNENADKILRSREDFKDKRSGAGKVSYVMKYMAKNYTKEYKNITLRIFLKDNFDFSIDLKNEQMIKQVFEQVFELYRNEYEDENKDIKETEVKEKKQILNFHFDTENFKTQWQLWKVYRKKKHKFTYFDDESEQKALTELFNLSNKDEKTAMLIIRQSIDNGWKGFFELKQETKPKVEFIETRLKK